MGDRSAIDTIKGYFYQFDYTILSLLKLSQDTDAITIEGIEDIDISVISLQSTTRSGACLNCCISSKRIHSYYTRKIDILLPRVVERLQRTEV